MTQSLIMNGMTSHAFAAIMATTVLVFPTPNDLWDAVFDNEPTIQQAKLVSGGIDRPVTGPRQYNNDSLIEDQLDLCVGSLSGQLSDAPASCLQTVRNAAQELVDGRPAGEPLDPLGEKLRLALLHYCRAAWTVAAQKNRAFDMTDCETNPHALAEPI